MSSADEILKLAAEVARPEDSYELRTSAAARLAQAVRAFFTDNPQDVVRAVFDLVGELNLLYEDSREEPHQIDLDRLGKLLRQLNEVAFPACPGCSDPESLAVVRHTPPLCAP